MKEKQESGAAALSLQNVGGIFVVSDFFIFVVSDVFIFVVSVFL